MKATITAKDVLLKIKRHVKGCLWGLFYLAKAVTGIFILVLAVSVTAICYVLAAPFFLYLTFKAN